MTNLPVQLRETADAVARLGAVPAHFVLLSDPALIDAQRAITANRRALDTYAAMVAGEISRRSHRDLGDAGLAQRSGFLSPEALIVSVSQTTKSDASKFVNVGVALTTNSPIAEAVIGGTFSIDGAEAVRRGLGRADEVVTQAALDAAGARLISENTTTDADELLRRARAMRDELDADSVARREREHRDLRYFRHVRQPDGMHRGSFLLDAEDGALVAAAFDAILSPRRGGPRFVDPDERAAAEQLLRDERSNDQITADAFVDLVNLAVKADPGTLFGSRRPAVRVVVTATALSSGDGHGRLEDSGDSVSLQTVERHICDTGVVGVQFDDNGECVNVGREQRLFTARQRIGLAVRDGGCRWPDCDRPPSWSEAHHINQWQRDAGRTDLADGVLLCRRHHLLLHNNHWEIGRHGPDYWLTPPRAVDATQRRIAMPSKNPQVERLSRAPQTA